MIWEHELKKIFWSVAWSKIKKKVICYQILLMGDGKTHTLYHGNIRALGWWYGKTRVTKYELGITSY